MVESPPFWCKDEIMPTAQEILDANTATQQHINLVRMLLRVAATEILIRGEYHDQSKFSPEEVEMFAVFSPKLKGMTYGSDEYKQCLKDMGAGLRHHYDNNRHHPEFHRQDEEWRDVVEFEGHYEVSNYGNVRSVSREVERSGPTGNLVVEGRDLNQYVTPKGYARIRLQAGEKRRNAMVHVLVAEAFIPNPNGRPQVNHINGWKRDNRVANLEWATPSENLQHAYETGLRQANAKYVVTCEELGISTIGCTEMEDRLQSMGYPKARAANIWRAAHEGGKHLDLTFTATRFERWMNSPISQMNLIDLLEMFIDWMASSKRHADGDIRKSIEINQKRFGMSDDLVALFMNTIAVFEKP